MSQDKSFSYKKAETSPPMGRERFWEQKHLIRSCLDQTESDTSSSWKDVRPSVVTGTTQIGLLAEDFCQLGIAWRVKSQEV